MTGFNKSHKPYSMGPMQGWSQVEAEEAPASSVFLQSEGYHDSV